MNKAATREKRAMGFYLLFGAILCALFILGAFAGIPVAFAENDADNESALQPAVIRQLSEDISLTAQADISPSTTVYHAVNSKSGIYHLSNSCSGIKHFESMTYAEATSRGYRACKVCASDTGSGSQATTGSVEYLPEDVEEGSMFRMYNPNSGEHFYTASIDEGNTLVKWGWNYEGIGWIAPTTSSTPVYRLYSETDHHYTTSASEKDWLVKMGWTYEGIGWYSDDAQGTPLYRQFNPYVNPSAPTNNSGSHNYTASKAENDSLVKVGWRAEGIGWYGVAY